ncbi:glycosyltransferase family 61 protein [Asaia spathodeae]|uniref:glycosyltransferase family 61 protein n=1 Tax=Asaia spathodeae TaxID=657016 RepID=UPI002156DF9A|nr:glycosyltransferase family 61 protein [Asaia spathodeae]GBR12563.1 capsular polysaccharide biosynthesis protein-like protein [Asaia spathodeae NBRC 105894]
MLQEKDPHCPNTFGRSLVLTGNPSFSHHEAALVRHHTLYTPGGILIENATYCAGENIAGAFDYHVYAPRVISPDAPVCDGPEDCFWLGYFHDHFGHFLTSTLQRLWHIQKWQRHYAGYVFPNRRVSEQNLPFMSRIFEVLNINETQIFHVPENTMMRNIMVAEPAFIENAHCYEIWGTFMRELGRKILGSRGTAPEKYPVFLSRNLTRSPTRSYDGEDELTSLLMAFGIRSCHPECLSLQEQMALWDSHAVFIGFSGSAFMNAAFFENKTLIVLNHDGYVFGTQRMIDSIAGNRALYLDVSPFLELQDATSQRYRITTPGTLAAGIVTAIRRLG